MARKYKEFKKYMSQKMDLLVCFVENAIEKCMLKVFKCHLNFGFPRLYILFFIFAFGQTLRMNLTPKKIF